MSDKKLIRRRDSERELFYDDISSVQFSSVIFRVA